MTTIATETLDLTLYPEWVDLVQIGDHLASTTTLKGNGIRLTQVEYKWPDGHLISAMLRTFAKYANGEQMILVMDRNTKEPVSLYHVAPPATVLQIDLDRIDLFGITISDLTAVAGALQK